MGAEEFIPADANLSGLAKAAAGCRGCELYQHAGQTVFGEGPAPARLMLVGEQPGDREDREGHPFVGPAGLLLDRALEEAGIPRGEIYVTNVVKHFRFEQRGKRRIHKKPSQSHVEACMPWLIAELERVKPAGLVLLGATAAQALLGRSFRVTASRGKPVESDLAPLVMATVHPSSLLRLTEGQDREAEFVKFVHDLSVASRLSG